MPPSAPIASLDLGSNSFRLMLAERSGAGWARKRVFQEFPRLAEGLTPGSSLAPEALRRAWAALEMFAAEIKAAGGREVLAGGTMAARLAADGPAFLAEAARRYGWATRLLSDEEEAWLTAAGVLAGLNFCPPETLIFDIGGLSTEFISVSGGLIGRTRSLELGVVSLTENHHKAPERPDLLAAIGETARAALTAAGFDETPAALVGTAGTVTTVAAILLGHKTYNPDLLNNVRLARPAVAGLLAEMAPLSLARRVADYGLHPRRADVLPAGLVLALEIMDHFRRPDLVVSDNGLLEGLWLAAAAPETDLKFQKVGDE